MVDVLFKVESMGWFEFVFPVGFDTLEVVRCSGNLIAGLEGAGQRTVKACRVCVVAPNFAELEGVVCSERADRSSFRYV